MAISEPAGGEGMNIALVSPYDYAYPGGANTHIALLTREFLRRGHRVKIVAPSSKSADTLGVENFVRLGVPIPIPANGSLARVSFSLWLTPKVKALLRAEQFDVIHLHEPLASLLSLAVLRNSRSLNIGTFHSFWTGARRFKGVKPLLRPYFDMLHGRIVVSPPAGQFLDRLFPSEHEVIPNPVDLEHFARPAPPLPQFQDGKTNILFVGRMEKRKGFRYLLEAYSRLKWDYPNIRLIVVTTQTPDKESYGIMGERHLEDVVLCKASYAELPRYHQAAHIFCAPNTGKESFGMVLTEAMAAGLPIVATNNEGFASVVDDGVHGLLVPPRDDAALAGALKRLLDDPGLRQRIAAEGARKSHEYGVERVATRVLQFYEETRQRVHGRAGAQAPTLAAAP